MNPIIPHFAQYCWKNYIYPVLANSSNYDHSCTQNLGTQPWPKTSCAFDKVAASKLSYLKDIKGTIRLGYEKAKTGGGKKKGGKGKDAGPVEPASVEKCVIFLAKEYPEFQKKCL